jgi:hypothetical protein
LAFVLLIYIVHPIRNVVTASHATEWNAAWWKCNLPMMPDSVIVIIVLSLLIVFYKLVWAPLHPSVDVDCNTHICVPQKTKKNCN